MVKKNQKLYIQQINAYSAFSTLNLSAKYTKIYLRNVKNYEMFANCFTCHLFRICYSDRHHRDTKSKRAHVQNAPKRYC